VTAPQPDGNLPLAMRELDDAVRALCSPLSRLINNRLVQIPSRYLQLRDATDGEQSNTGGGGGAKSRPPFWTDAFDLIREIDDALACWQPAFTGVPATIGRLRCLQARPWRPQDCRQISQITAACLEWAGKVDALLDPPRRWSLPSPCPACGTAIVYRRDGDDMVRQAALQLAAHGCHCTKCHAVWAPDKFVFLARLLGSLPENVLE
jgi:hypothetical protein